MAKEELSALKESRIGKIKSNSTVTRRSKRQNIIMEIRGAAGGDEAALLGGRSFEYVSKIMLKHKDYV